MNSNDINKITANMVESEPAAWEFYELSTKIEIAARSPRILRMDLAGGYTHPIPTFILRPDDILTKRLKRVQVRFPKSKRKRIRKKWSKRDCNYEYRYTYVAVKMGNVILLHSSIYNKYLQYTKTIDSRDKGLEFDDFFVDEAKTIINN